MKTVNSNTMEKTTSVCCAQNHLFSRDGISPLPDEISVSVLSLLGIREAGRTCVLSKRWELLWSYHRVLNFDASQTIYDLESNPNPKLLKLERSRYINWVNKVTESHRGSTIDEFGVSFFLNRSSSCVIDRWIEFAISREFKGLKVLEITCCPKLMNLEFSSYFSQLKTLSLTVNFLSFPKANAAFEQLPEFSKLKHLTLELVADNFSKLLVWTTLMNASPFLHKCKLQIIYLGPCGKQYERKMLEGGNCPHQSLKEVELAGFVGRVIDLEFAHYLIKNAVTLEKIIIDRHCAGRPSPWLFEETKEKQYAKQRAMELQKSLPSRVKMEII